MFRLVAITVCLIGLGACTHIQIKKDEDAVRALEQICAYGVESAKVGGAAWIKAESAEAKGQFPAEIEATHPGNLMMEVTNLIGETQARIKVEGSTYKIEVPGREARVEEGEGSWGGIPLQWAAALFLGRFPCPGEISDSRLSVHGEVDNVVVAERMDGSGKPLEEYYYRVKSWGGQPWPEELQWTRAGAAPVSVVFKFEKPDMDSGAPMRWEAKSDRGEVKVRWRRRNVEKTTDKT